jgi:hypothetical protein
VSSRRTWRRRSKYAPLSEHEDYDWAIVPFEEYMHGFASPDFAPMIGTPKLQRAIERYNFGPLFSRALKTTGPEQLPDGQWRAALATRFDRNIYILSVATSAADDAIIVAAFNAAPNKSRFNFFYRNCSNQAKGIFWTEMVETLGFEYERLPSPARDQKGKTGRGEPSRGFKGAMARTGQGIPVDGSSTE